MLPKQLWQKNMIYFIEKMYRLDRPIRSLVIKRKFIANAKNSRIRARDLYRKGKKLTGSDNRVAWRRTFLGPLYIVKVDWQMPYF